MRKNRFEERLGLIKKNYRKFKYEDFTFSEVVIYNFV